MPKRTSKIEVPDERGEGVLRNSKHLRNRKLGQRYVTSNKSREEHFPLPILELVTTTIARRTRPANPKSKKTRVSHIKQKTAIASVKSHIVTVNETTSRRHHKKRDVALTVDKHDQELDPARQQGGAASHGSLKTVNCSCGPIQSGSPNSDQKSLTNHQKKSLANYQKKSLTNQQNCWLVDEFFLFRSESVKSRFKDSLVRLVDPRDLVQEEDTHQNHSHSKPQETTTGKRRSAIKEKFITQNDIKSDSDQVPPRPRKKAKKSVSRSPSPLRNFDAKSIRKNLEFSFIEQPDGVNYPYINELSELDNCVPLPRQPRSANLVLHPHASLNGETSGMRLPTVQQSLPYNTNNLTWNREKTKNKQDVYCYCGEGGEWYRGMVQCVRCSQWFHERCLAPRPRNMPIVQGDTHYLLVCSACNFGVECLRRMPVSWQTFLHIAIFDLSMKSERMYHDLKTELFGPLLSNWHLYQLPRHINLLPDHIKEKTLLHLLTTSPDYVEVKGGWGLRSLLPPPRGNYKLNDTGFVSERNVLDDVITGPDLPNTDVVRMAQPAPKPSASAAPTSGPSAAAVAAAQSRKASPPQAILPASQNQTKPSQQSRTKISNSTSFKRGHHTRSSKLKNKNGLIGHRPNRRVSRRQAAAGKTAHESDEPVPLLEKPLEVVKPLPFQIAKDLFNQGFPKVCVKFASIIPPKKQEIEAALVKKLPKKKRPRQRQPHAKPSTAAKRTATAAAAVTLDAMIPTKQDYLGSNNPFESGLSNKCGGNRSLRNRAYNLPRRQKERTRKQKHVAVGAEKRKLWKVPHLSLVNGLAQSVNGNSHTTKPAIISSRPDSHKRMEITQNGSINSDREAEKRATESKSSQLPAGRVLRASSGRRGPRPPAAAAVEIAGRCRSKSGDIRYLFRGGPDPDNLSSPEP